jgi:hypothetical protein
MQLSTPKPMAAPTPIESEILKYIKEAERLAQKLVVFKFMNRSM